MSYAPNFLLERSYIFEYPLFSQPRQRLPAFIGAEFRRKLGQYYSITNQYINTSQWAIQDQAYCFEQFAIF